MKFKTYFWGVIAFSIVFLLITAGVINKSYIVDFGKAVEKQQYEKAAKIYLTHIKGTKSETAAVSIVEQHTRTIISNYNGGSSKYDEGNKQLEQFLKMNINHRAVKERKVMLDKLKQSKTDYLEGEKFSKQGEYEKAILSFQKVILEDSNYKQAQNAVKEQKDKCSKALQNIKAISYFQGQMRDANGSKYEVYLFSEDAKKETVSNEKTWVGALEGEAVLSGNMKIAYKAKNSNYFKTFTVGNKTLNISRELIRIINNNYNAKRDFLMISEVDGSQGSRITLYQIKNGSMENMIFKAKGNSEMLPEGFTCGTRKPFFVQADSDTFETAIYDNADTFKFYIEQWKLTDKSVLEYVGNTKEMSLEEYVAYKRQHSF